MAKTKSDYATMKEVLSHTSLWIKPKVLNGERGIKFRTLKISCFPNYILILWFGYSSKRLIRIEVKKGPKSLKNYSFRGD